MTEVYLVLFVPALVVALSALALQSLAGFSAFKVARCLAALPSGLAVVMLAATSEAHDTSGSLLLGAAAFMLALSSVGPWLVTFFFWRRTRQRPQPEASGPGLSASPTGRRD